MLELSWDQVLAWRMRRHFVSPAAEVGAADVVGRLCGVQAQVSSAAELAVRLRGANPEHLVAGLEDGSLVKTWAMRGTLHLFRAGDVRNHLALVAAAGIWTKPTWSRAFGATPDQVHELGQVVSRVLTGTVLTRDELVQAVVDDGAFAALEQQLRSGWGALLKPLAWTGVLCYGPPRGAAVTFTSPAGHVADWGPLPDPEVAAPSVIKAYLGAYGPATPQSFDNWLSRNSHRKTTVRGWFAGLGDELVEVDVEGRRAFLAAEHADEVAATRPAPAVALLGPFDQYVLGPGTGDPAVLPAHHRSQVSRAAGWISPVVVSNGRIVGVWSAENGVVTCRLFDDVRPPAARRLQSAVRAVERLLGPAGQVR